MSKLLIINKLTRWRCMQSQANRSPGQIPCKQGNLQGKLLTWSQESTLACPYRTESRPVLSTCALVLFMNQAGNFHIGSGTTNSWIRQHNQTARLGYLWRGTLSTGVGKRRVHPN